MYPQTVFPAFPADTVPIGNADQIRFFSGDFPDFPSTLSCKIVRDSPEPRYRTVRLPQIRPGSIRLQYDVLGQVFRQVCVPGLPVGKAVQLVQFCGNDGVQWFHEFLR